MAEIFNSNTSTDTKIAVLEERISSYETMLRKIDEAIQIMGKTSQNISKMLAVHEERIEQCHRADDYIGRLIEELKKLEKQQKQEHLFGSNQTLKHSVHQFIIIKLW